MHTQGEELVELVARLREIEERIVELTAILNALPAHIALLDTDGNIIDVNQAWRRFGETNLLIDSRDGVGYNYLQVCDAAPLEAAEAHRTAAGIRAVLAGELETFSLEYPCHGPEVKRWFNLVVAPLRLFHRGGVVVMHIDITDRKLVELDLQRAVNLFKASNDGVVITDAEGVIRDVNPAFSLISGFGREELLAQHITFHPGLNGHGLGAEIERGVEQAGYWSGEVRSRRKNGEVYIQKVSVSGIRGEQGQIINYISVVPSVTRLREHEAELDRVAHHDVLTDRTAQPPAAH